MTPVMSWTCSETLVTPTLADPESTEIHELRAAIYQQRREGETSLMAKGIFGHAANQSKAKRE